MLIQATIEALKRRSELYVRAADFDGRPRERMVAMGEADELFFRLYPQHYRSLQLVRVASQLNESQQAQVEKHCACENQVVGIISAVVHDAVRAGDLALQGGARPGELAFTMWALAFGARALMNSRTAAAQLGVADGGALMRGHVSMLLDAVGWRPLLDEWDYEGTRRRIQQELFAEEWRQAFAA
jgi:hypothetical protein